VERVRCVRLRGVFVGPNVQRCGESVCAGWAAGVDSKGSRDRPVAGVFANASIQAGRRAAHGQWPRPGGMARHRPFRQAARFSVSKAPRAAPLGVTRLSSAQAWRLALVEGLIPGGAAGFNRPVAFGNRSRSGRRQHVSARRGSWQNCCRVVQSRRQRSRHAGVACPVPIGAACRTDSQGSASSKINAASLLNKGIRELRFRHRRCEQRICGSDSEHAWSCSARLRRRVRDEGADRLAVQ